MLLTLGKIYVHGFVRTFYKFVRFRVGVAWRFSVKCAWGWLKRGGLIHDRVRYIWILLAQTTELSCKRETLCIARSTHTQLA